jgi:phage gp29-like protein
MVGRGNEKFEVGKDTGGGNADNFDKLIERANSEISKRILGGSGVTDEKSFVGSAEIQFRLTKDRFESDKLLVKNVINQQLFPRLLKLSPVYSVLNGHYFDWDNSENYTAKEVAELVSLLGTHFELDPEQISEKTGLKILSQKANPIMPPTEEEKKKSNVTK